MTSRFFSPCIIAVSLWILPQAAFADRPFAWGRGVEGQLGIGTQNGTSTPTPVVALTNANSLSTGFYFSLGAYNGAAYGWGYNFLGQLGDGATSGAIYTTPISIPSLSTGVSAVAAGYSHSLAIKDGAVYSWGFNTAFGVLGYPAGPNNSTPHVVLVLTSGVTAISAGETHNLAIRNGALYTWGRNQNGELGQGTTSFSIQSPVTVPALSSGVTDISSGKYHSLAVKNGAAYAWGGNSAGQIGNGNNDDANSPYAIPSLSSGVTAVAAGNDFSLALKDGHVYAWGANYNGQVGDGSTTDRNTPYLIPGLSNIVDVAAEFAAGFALDQDGSLWVWGYNGAGELGLGESSIHQTPAHLLPPAGYVYTSINATSTSIHTFGTLAPVPEPASLSLLALAAPLLLRRKR